MFKWFVALFIGLAIFAAVTPALRRFGLGRLPGDLQLHIRGRRYDLPLASSVLLSLLVGLLLRWL